MNEESLRGLLDLVAAGQLPSEEALDMLRTLPFTEAASSLLDTHRAIRQGMPEVVYARGKTAEQVRNALDGLHKAHGHALATAVTVDTSVLLSSVFTQGNYDDTSRLFRIGSMAARGGDDSACVICAGTSDLPVAEEAAQTLEFAGFTVKRIRDVGVAGLHRLLSQVDQLRSCKVVIAIAGMEGALPGVVSGLVAAPVIAVPTSVGYGTSFGGLSALLSMLNSCSSGMGVVNIDNGFGAAMLAIRILQAREPHRTSQS
jgi:NCAIR mutase (PurE)-related protein